MNNRVLVTGAAGCIGRHCLPLLLQRGWDIHAVSSRSKPAPVPGVMWHQADLCDIHQLTALVNQVTATHLLHLAWYVVPGKSGASPENVKWLQASLELVRRFQEQGGRRLVIAGSSFEYDMSYGFCSEHRTPLNSDSLYGVCKNGLRAVVESYAAQTGLSQAWPRIFDLYGPYEQTGRLIPYVVRALLSGEVARCSHGNQIRDYLYVEDVAAALVTILDSEFQGPINIGSGHPITLRDIVSRAAEKLDALDRVQFGAITTRPNEAPLVVADVTKLSTRFGWKPTFDLDRGLDCTINWWCERSKEQTDR